jgi:hypothetical protein
VHFQHDAPLEQQLENAEIETGIKRQSTLFLENIQKEGLAFNRE